MHYFIIYDNTNLKSMSSSAYNNDISIVTQDTKKPFFNTVYQYIYKHISKNNVQNKTKKFTDNIKEEINSYSSLGENINKVSNNIEKSNLDSHAKALAYNLNEELKIKQE